MGWLERMGCISRGNLSSVTKRRVDECPVAKTMDGM